MNVVGLNAGHDGAIALLVDGALRVLIEGEKDSGPRYGPVSVASLLTALREIDVVPDAIAVGGWKVSAGGGFGRDGLGYLGLGPPAVRRERILGHELAVVSSTHERSHIFLAQGLAPKDHDDVAVLVWEGDIGAFYRVRGQGDQITRIPVLEGPGDRYAFLFCLADPTFRDNGDLMPLDVAGKLMALAAFGSDKPSNHVKSLVDRLLGPRQAPSFRKIDFSASRVTDAGHDDPEVRDAARHLSRGMFEVFRRAAYANLPHGLPLLIGGGCGLNCEWNSKWASDGHFSDVFVPPCPNDSGSALGTAIDAQRALGGPARVEWAVDCGAAFDQDVQPTGTWHPRVGSPEAVADLLSRGAVLAYVDGRAEIGPRALGHRSLLASPMTESMRDRLNQIKRRESYRPIAPMCLATEFDDHFVGHADPYMLYFATVRHGRLPAVTHVDGSARVQLVPDDGSHIARILASFGTRSGCAVLCNTSLNLPGRGFINRMSDLLRFCAERGIEHFVVNGTLWEHLDGPASKGID